MASSECLPLFVRQFNGQIFRVVVKRNSTLEDLMDAIEDRTGIGARSMLLSFAGKRLEHEDPLPVLPDSMVDLVLRLGGGDPYWTSWDRYLGACTFSRSDKRIEIKFRRPLIDRGDVLLDIDQALARLASTTSPLIGAPAFQNGWGNYMDAEATNAFWTDHQPTARVLVLALRPELESTEELDLVRYGGPNIQVGSYYGGDRRSWQRYTDRLPLETELTPTFDPTGTKLVSLSILIKEDFEPARRYAIAYLHNLMQFQNYINQDTMALL